MLLDQTDEILNKLILGLQSPSVLRNYYDACMGYEQTSSASMALLKDEISKIDAVSAKSELTMILAHLHEMDAYLWNQRQLAIFGTHRNLDKIGQPVDRSEWEMMPWEINAYYDASNNEFVFPFGILQPPSLDLTASNGVNMGSFGGGTIGHELTHGYDSDGHRYDGSKTLPENLADQGGVKLGYLALLELQKKPSSPELWLGKYNENQQYWIAYAQSWCTKTKPEALRSQIKTDPHPPEEFRVNTVLMNRPEFAQDFQCSLGQRMAPAERCELW